MSQARVLRLPPHVSGFALLPFILIMLVMTGLVSAGMMLLPRSVELEHAQQTIRQLRTQADTIMAWSVVRGRLPDNVGLAGVVGVTTDSWGKGIVYVYDAQLASAAATSGVCGRTTTPITHNGSPVAFALISGGADMQINSVPAGSGGYSGTLAGLSSADLVVTVTLEELKQRAGCYGRTPGRLKIVNSELPKWPVSEAYGATVIADGGIPFTGGNYRWCMQTPSGVLPAGLISVPATISTNCSLLAETAWGTGATLSLAGSSAPPVGDYPLTVFVRDNNDSAGTADGIDQKKLNLHVY